MENSTMYVALIESESLIGKISHLVLADILDKDDPKEVISLKLSKLRGYVNMSAELVDITKLSELKDHIMNGRFKFYVYYEDKYVWREFPNKKVFNCDNSSCREMLTMLYNANSLTEHNMENISRTIKTETLALNTRFIYMNKGTNEELDLSEFKDIDISIVMVNPSITELMHVCSDWLKRIKGTDIKLAVFIIDTDNYIYRVTSSHNIKIEKI